MQPQDLVAIRRRLGFTQTQLADKLGYAGKSRISQMETGYTRVPPRLAMLLRRMDTDDQVVHIIPAAGQRMDTDDQLA